MPNLDSLGTCVDLTPLILNPETSITRRNQIKIFKCSPICINKIADQIKCFPNVEELQVFPTEN